MSACTVKVQDETLLIINIYNQPKTLLGFEALEEMLRLLTPPTLLLPTVLVTDANLHSPLWNPLEYQAHEAATDTMVETMLRWILYLRSPKGVPTYEAKAGMSSCVTIDLVWINQQADDLLIACAVDVEGLLNHHSDHLALVTVVRVKSDVVTDPGSGAPLDKAWHKANQEKFLSELKALLPPLPSLDSHHDIDVFESTLSDHVINALNLSSPNKSRAHRHKAWWNPQTMGPLRRDADRARKFAKQHPSEEARATYRSARNKYFHTIETEKTHSW